MLKLNLQTEKVDLICLSETWLNEAIPNNFIKINGYNILRENRGWKENQMDGNFKRGGGLLCYIKDDLQVSGTRYRDLDCSCKDLVMQWLSFHGYQKGVECTVCGTV